ncbi:MAG: response regulator [Bacteroidetes bacterium]|jgi:signal transduction histidine kinase/CheY-like chemotaxis protein|nr:response regulator [Bacteroidota bacterium]
MASILKYKGIPKWYALLGWLVGLVIAVGATKWELAGRGYPFDLSHFINLQASNRLLWVIDGMPALLAVMAYLAGRKHAQLKETIEKDEATIDLRTEDLRKKNRELRREIEERKTTEKQLTIAKEDAERGKRAEELFLANMSHELRTPLNGVIGFTRLLLGTQLDATQNEYVNTIQTSANHLMAIINDILEISKIKAGEIEFEELPVSLTKLVMNAVNTFKALANQKKISLYEEIDRKIPPYILGDQTRLNQILLNLIGNAVKFTEQGSVVVRVKLEQETEQRVHLRFEVEDTGIGIGQDKLETIFDKFKQAEASTARNFGGTGLGLSICKNMVELQGGQISVTSEPGKGSIFFFTLNFKKSGPIEPGETVKGAVEIKDIGPLNLLLVEDNKINVKLAENVFKKWGPQLSYQVAFNGREALELMEKNNFDLILMDLQMPVMDGFEATRAIRVQFDKPKKNIPIIALTADVMASEKMKAFEAGINDYITKPFDANKLFVSISKLMASKRE